MNKTAKKKGKNEELTLTAQNESASKKKRPFEYNAKEDGGENLFSLKNLDPEEMRKMNNILREYIEVPKGHSEPKKTYIPSPDMRPEAIQDDNLTEM